MVSTKVDLKTNIKCPTCDTETVVNRYDCQCEDYWGYCKNQPGCKMFYCLTCEDEQKVDWADDPQDRARQAKVEQDFVVLPPAQEVQLREKFGQGVILPPRTWSSLERDTIRKMLDDITTPGFLEEEVEPNAEIDELIRLETGA